MGIYVSWMLMKEIADRANEKFSCKKEYKLNKVQWKRMSKESEIKSVTLVACLELSATGDTISQILQKILRNFEKIDVIKIN